MFYTHTVNISAVKRVNLLLVKCYIHVHDQMVISVILQQF